MRLQIARLDLRSPSLLRASGDGREESQRIDLG
jgi:hypothetical protein